MEVYRRNLENLGEDSLLWTTIRVEGDTIETMNQSYSRICKARGRMGGLETVARHTTLIYACLNYYRHKAITRMQLSRAIKELKQSGYLSPKTIRAIERGRKTRDERKAKVRG